MATPIDTRTQVEKVPVDAKTEETMRLRCDQMGVAGYLLSAAFRLGNDVMLIFQVPR